MFFWLKLRTLSVKYTKQDTDGISRLHLVHFTLNVTNLKLSISLLPNFKYISILF